MCHLRATKRIDKLDPRMLLPAVLAVAVSAFGGVVAGQAPPGLQQPAAETSWDQAFRSPPDDCKPWAYWWWLNANVTEQSITRDLEEAKAKGLGGFLLFDVTSYGHELVPPPPRKIPFMSERWRELIHHALLEADRLGLRLSMNLSTSGGSLQAPWDMGLHAPKQLVFQSIDVEGPAQVACRIKWPEKEFVEQVAVLAGQRGEASPGQVPASSAQQRDVSLAGPWKPVSVDDGWKGSLTALSNEPAITRLTDLTAQVGGDGKLVWDVPAGKWTLFCFACQLIPQRGNDVDILSAEAAEAHFRRMGKVVLDDSGPLAGKTLTHFYNVSWEGTSPSWTPGFEHQFRKYRGYEIRPYLPVLAGAVVQSREVSERFQRDFCRTLSDCFLHNSYGTFTRLCHEAGIKWHSESGGPWRNYPLFWHGDQLAFWGANDMPQGEFWWNKSRRSNARYTAMAAHIYGKPLASIEAFTHMEQHWSAYPAALKPLADTAFCDGVNWFIWHTCTASPPEFGKPGIVYFAGTHLNPNVTWWNEAGEFLTYLARCQTMLRRGQFIADVCCYTSDRVQRNWGRGETWSEKPSLVLPRGYTYDLLNTEVLLDRLQFQEGRLVLPGGMQYRLLVVDLEEEQVPPEVLEKVLRLAEAGATVVLGTRRAARAPGLSDYPNCDRRIERLAEELWGPNPQEPSSRPRGSGRIITGTPLGEVLGTLGIPPDCDTAWNWNHRRAEHGDIYFLAGSGPGECTFRVSGRQPELWDPMTGSIRPAPCYRTTDDGRTVVPLQLPENGSVFVVFRNPTAEPHVTSLDDPAGAAEICSTEPAQVRLRAWQPGRLRLTTSAGQHRELQVAQVPQPVQLAGPWQVRFAPGWGAPESMVFEKLSSWHEHALPAVKHFSGRARYEIAFELSQQQALSPARLQLGQVMCLASVQINGCDCGVVWTAPWTAELTGKLQPGRNELAVDVVNTWVNRLIGDAALPEDQRRTRTNVRLEPGDRTLRIYQSFGANDPLLPSGLLGPVRVEFAKEVTVPLGD